MSEFMAVAALGVAVLTLVIARYSLGYAIEQLERSRRAAEASIAAEVRNLNTKCRQDRGAVVQGFPLHASLIERHPPETWEIVADGEPLPGNTAAGVVSWLRDNDHVAVRRWDSLSDLSDEQVGQARVVVGFLNDLCQMLSDGTPGHFIFQQYHQQILTHGSLVVPVVHHSQTGGRWGVRLPSLINRAAIYHRLRPIHRETVIKIARTVDLAGCDSPPAAIEGARRVQLLIPVADNETGVTGDVWHEGVEDRPVEVDYAAFEDHYRDWAPPRMLP